MDKCRLCYLYHKDERYRLLWDSPASESARIAQDASGQTPMTQEPSLWQKSLNFAAALVSHVAAGMPQATAEEQERRMMICKECHYLNKDTLVCSHAKCGCLVNKKTAWAGQVCPVGKW